MTRLTHEMFLRGKKWERGGPFSFSFRPPALNWEVLQLATGTGAISLTGWLVSRYACQSYWASWQVGGLMIRAARRPCTLRTDVSSRRAARLDWRFLWPSLASAWRKCLWAAWGAGWGYWATGLLGWGRWWQTTWVVCVVSQAPGDGS